MSDRVVKLAVLVSHPIQYFAPVYRALANRPEIDLTVIYRTRVGLDAYQDPDFGVKVQWDIPLLEGYSSYFLSNKTSLGGFELAVIRTIAGRSFDVLIIHGYNSLTNLVAMAMAKLVGTKVLIRGDTRLQSHHAALPWWKSLFKRFLLSSADGCLSVGTLNRDYYRFYGVPPEKIWQAHLCVDNAFFQLNAHDHESNRIHFRNKHGIPEDAVVILFAGKFIQRKRAIDLVQAFAKIQDSRPKAWLLMVGSGEEFEAVVSSAHSLGVVRVKFVGFQNQRDLPAVYAASDVFVFPSAEEPWGLALNETMAAGLPAIVSDGVGAHPDLVRHQETGLLYPCGDVQALTDSLIYLLESPQHRKAMGKRAMDHIRDWDINACVSGTVEALLAQVN